MTKQKQKAKPVPDEASKDKAPRKKRVGARLSPEEQADRMLRNARRTMAAILSVDQGAQLSIQVALDRNQPLYVVRTRDGVTLDIDSVKARAFATARAQPDTCGARVYERMGDAMWPIVA